MGTVGWRLLGTAAALAAGAVATKVVGTAWRAVSGKEAPTDPSAVDETSLGRGPPVRRGPRSRGRRGSRRRRAQGGRVLPQSTATCRPATRSTTDLGGVPGRRRHQPGVAREFADLAVAAEDAGWDTIFTWEAVWGQDAWVTLAGPRCEPRGSGWAPCSPRCRGSGPGPRRPGRHPRQPLRRARPAGRRPRRLHPGWLAFERDEGRVRAKKLDEGLAIYDGLMRGQPFARERTTRSNPPTSSRPHRRSSSRGSRSGWSAPIPRDVPRARGAVGRDHPHEDGHIDANPFVPDDLRRVVSAVKEIREAKGLPWEGMTSWPRVSASRGGGAPPWQRRCGWPTGRGRRDRPSEVDWSMAWSTVDDGTAAGSPVAGPPSLVEVLLPGERAPGAVVLHPHHGRPPEPDTRRTRGRGTRASSGESPLAPSAAYTEAVPLRRTSTVAPAMLSGRPLDRSATRTAALIRLATVSTLRMLTGPCVRRTWASAFRRR